MNCQHCLQVDGKTIEVFAHPVKLIEKDGKITTVCYVSRCIECGWIAHYGKRFLYKFQGKIPDFNIEYWQELRRNEINASDFEAAIFEIPSDRLIVLDSRNDLEFDWDGEPQQTEKFYEYVERYLDRIKIFHPNTKRNLLKLFKQNRGLI